MKIGNWNFIIRFTILIWKSKLKNLMNETRRESKRMNEMVNQKYVIKVFISCKMTVFWEVEMSMENLKHVSMGLTNILVWF